VVLATIALAAGLMSLTSEKATFRRLIAVAAIAAALFFLRNFYTALPAAAIVLTRLRAKRGSPLRRLMVRTAAVCCMGGALFLVSNSVWFQEISLGAALTMKIAEYGWGAQIHNVPVIGPVVYALITPLPPRLTDLTAGVAWTDLLRSVGMLAILVLLAVQSTAAVRTQAVTDKRWRTFLHLGVIVFLLSAYGSLEARHRLAAIPCLMVCYGIVRQRAAAVQAARALSFAASGRRRPPLAPAAIALPSRTA
jgi:hypothetical protein